MNGTARKYRVEVNLKPETLRISHASDDFTDWATSLLLSNFLGIIQIVDLYFYLMHLL